MGFSNITSTTNTIYFENINEYKEVALLLQTSSGEVITTILPLVIFKTDEKMLCRVAISGGAYESVFAKYVNDTSANLYVSNNSFLTAKLYGIK